MQNIMIPQVAQLKCNFRNPGSEKLFQLMVNISRWLLSCLLLNTVVYVAQERYLVLKGLQCFVAA